MASPRPSEKNAVKLWMHEMSRDEKFEAIALNSGGNKEEMQAQKCKHKEFYSFYRVDSRVTESLSQEARQAIRRRHWWDLSLLWIFRWGGVDKWSKFSGSARRNREGWREDGYDEGKGNYVTWYWEAHWLARSMDNWWFSGQCAQTRRKARSQ